MSGLRPERISREDPRRKLVRWSQRVVITPARPAKTAQLMIKIACWLRTMEKPQIVPQIAKPGIVVRNRRLSTTSTVLGTRKCPTAE